MSLSAEGEKVEAVEAEGRKRSPGAYPDWEPRLGAALWTAMLYGGGMRTWDLTQPDWMLSSHCLLPVMT